MDDGQQNHHPVVHGPAGQTETSLSSQSIGQTSNGHHPTVSSSNGHHHCQPDSPSSATTTSHSNGHVVVNGSGEEADLVVEEEEGPEIDIVISNITCDFTTKCHLNLRKIAMEGSNVEYRRDQGCVWMKLRNPNVTARIHSTGKINVQGSTSEEAAKKSVRRVGRCLQKLGFKVRIKDFRISNVLAVVNFPFGVDLVSFYNEFTGREYNSTAFVSYEPEIFPAVDYKLKGSGTKKYKYSLRIFESGAISVTASNVSLLHDAVQHIYPLIFQFKKQKPNASHLSHMKKRKREEEDPSSRSRRTFKRRRRGSCEEEDDVDLQNFVVDDDEVEEESSSEEEEAQFTSDEEED